MPVIDRNSPVPYYQQVYEQIAQGIESGVYPVGKKLPSIRECARELGVSNTTIELAYQKLTEEGYVQARRGSGYTICQVSTVQSHSIDRFSEDYRQALKQLVEDDSPAFPPDEAILPNSVTAKATREYEFAYDAVDPSLFPFTTWARICREVFFGKDAEQACLYNDRQGLSELREQIANYVNSEFGLSCTTEQVLVMPTTRDLITSITSLFEPTETTFAMEDPGYDEVWRRLSENGFSITTIPVHPYPSWETIEQVIEGSNVVFLTPACQFPTNRTMPFELRKHLVEWARKTGAYLIDDEYGWEFQSGITRTPTLAAIDDNGRVITIGTFSNSFTPAVCLSYAILPPQLMLRWRARQRGTHPQVPWQTQAAMAMFMREDHWRTHIRKMRTAMQRKRETLINAIDVHMGNEVEVLAGQSNLFVLVETLDEHSEAELVESAANAGVRVYPTNRYWCDEPPANWRYVLIGYSGIAEADIELGIAKLAEAWGLARSI